MFQLILTFIRNLLAVDDSFSPLTRTTTSGNALASYFKDELLKRLFEESVTDLLLALTQHVGGDQPFLRKDNLLILEIFNYLFWGQSPDVIATSSDGCRKVTKVLTALPMQYNEQILISIQSEWMNFSCVLMYIFFLEVDVGLSFIFLLL